MATGLEWELNLQNKDHINQKITEEKIAYHITSFWCRVLLVRSFHHFYYIFLLTVKTVHV